MTEGNITDDLLLTYNHILCEAGADPGHPAGTIKNSDLLWHS